MKFFIPLAVLILFPNVEIYCQVEKKPNIIFVLADDLGWADVNIFDPLHRDFYETPNIDKLAKQGIKFNQAYSNAANCAPTRAAFFSGQYYPHQPVYHEGQPSNGKMISASNAEELPPEKFTIAEALKEGGYATGFVGKWHIGNPPTSGPLQQGFSTNVGGYKAGNPGSWKGGYFDPGNNPFIRDAKEGEYLTDYLTRKGIEFIEDHSENPFYLQLSYYTPHRPHQAPEYLVQKYQKKIGRNGHKDPFYASMIESLDRGVGLIMDKLEDLGINNNTILIFYSDNGGVGGYGFLGHEEKNVTDNSPLKGGKGTFYEGGIRVPLIIRWPEVIPPRAESNEPVIGIDFFPTFLEAAGLAIPEDYLLDGISIMALLKDPVSLLDRQSLYWHFPGYPNSAWRTGPVSIIRKGDWKLLKFYESDHVELYNIKIDIAEQDNLAEKLPEMRVHLRKDLENWLSEARAPMPLSR